MFRTERAKRSIAMAMAFLLCFTMVPTPAFAVNDDGLDQEVSAEEIALTSEEEDITGSGEAAIQANAEHPVLRAGTINVTVPIAFNFGGDSGYNVDLGVPEGGYLSTSGNFINKGTGIAQVAGLTCTDAGASTVLSGADNQKIFGLRDDAGAEVKFGYSADINTVNLDELSDVDPASYGMISNSGKIFECRLYFDNGVSISSSAVTDNGLSVSPLAKVVFTVRALPDGLGTEDNWFIHDKVTGKYYTQSEVVLHSEDIVKNGTSSPYYTRYMDYIRADVNAVKAGYSAAVENRIVQISDSNGPYSDAPYVDGKPIQDIDTYLNLYPETQSYRTLKVETKIHTTTLPNDAYECKLSVDGTERQFRIIGLQSSTNANSGSKTGITFESLDAFSDRHDTGDGFANNDNYVYSKWNYSYGVLIDPERIESNKFFPLNDGLSMYDRWAKINLSKVAPVELSSGSAYFFPLAGSDVFNSSSTYQFYSLLELDKQMVFGDYEITNYARSEGHAAWRRWNENERKGGRYYSGGCRFYDRGTGYKEPVWEALIGMNFEPSIYTTNTGSTVSYNICFAF